MELSCKQVLAWWSPKKGFVFESCVCFVELIQNISENYLTKYKRKLGFQRLVLKLRFKEMCTRILDSITTEVDFLLKGIFFKLLLLDAKVWGYGDGLPNTRVLTWFFTWRKTGDSYVKVCVCVLSFPFFLKNPLMPNYEGSAPIISFGSTSKYYSHI